MKTAFWDTVSCSLVGVDQYFRDETLVYSETTWCYVPEGSHLDADQVKEFSPCHKENTIYLHYRYQVLNVV
jgi:hypothetical protein